MLKVSEKSNRAALESGCCTSNTHMIYVICLEHDVVL